MTPEQKLKLYRKLEADVKGGLMFAIDIFNEAIKSFTEEKKKQLDEYLNSINKELEIKKLTGPQGKEGKQGLQGIAGIQGLPGKDGKDGKDGKVGRDGRDGRDGLDGIDGKNGENGVVEMSIVEELIYKIINDPKFQIDASRVRNLPGNKRNSKHLTGGGGDSVVAGSGITITRDSNNMTTISATGFVGSSVVDEVPSGSGTAFTLAHTPTAGTVKLYRGGARITVRNGDYTISGANITLSYTLISGETLTADYNY